MDALNLLLNAQERLAKPKVRKGRRFGPVTSITATGEVQSHCERCKGTGMLLAYGRWETGEKRKMILPPTYLKVEPDQVEVVERSMFVPETTQGYLCGKCSLEVKGWLGKDEPGRVR